MSHPGLTPDRQRELAALLDDKTRLQRDYPRLAEYWEISRALPGTGNDADDEAFDLRMAHYLTCDPSATEDPYWEIVRPAVSRRGSNRVTDGGSKSGSGRLAFAQMVLQDVYAYAIPSPETVAWIAEFSKGRSIVELGAGRGYWAARISRAGLAITAYDIAPPESGANVSFSTGGSTAAWHEVFSCEQLALTSEAVLLLCWPPGWGDNMALTALRDFEAVGGNRLVYIGEPKGGKNANDEFFAALSTGWTLGSVDREFVSWWNLFDGAQGWTREA